MINSKTALFKQDNRFNLFDEIILDWERGIHSPKPTHYDVIIDDSPYNIQHYLNNNPNVRAVLTGQVPLPTGYTYVEGTSTSEATTPTSWGVVVKDGSDNEWVWVPVNSTESIAPSGMYI